MLNTIYKITNKVNGKVYIGKTTCVIEKRFREHINDSKKERCNKRPLYDAINKYGEDNFYIEIVETDIPDENINDREIFYIRYFNSYVGFENSNGYNATLGGDSRRYKNIDIAVILSDYDNGLSCLEIGKKHRIDYSYVSDILRANDRKVLNSKERQSKSIYQIDKDTGEIIAKFNSAGDASIALFGNKRKRSSINNALVGYQNTAFGYRWEFCS